MRVFGILGVVLIAMLGGSVAAQERPLPIIDMHAHAVAATSQGPPPLAICSPMPDIVADPDRPWPAAFMSLLKKPTCPDPIWSPATDDELMTQTLATMARLNVFGVVSGTVSRVQQWKSAPNGDRVMPALLFQLGPQAATPETIAQLHADGQIVVLGEVTNQYIGITASDPTFEPYLAMAEQRGLPVGIHVGTGPPGAPYLGSPKYRASLHSPLVLEEALIKHPKLRVYAMHAGWPMIDDMLAVLYTHPQLYVDTAVIDYILPRAEFHRYLQRLVEAGFGKRVMFGSDQMVWPAAIERAVQNIESAAFLSESQKRDILYNNAARFLRLTEQQIAQHHGRAR